MATKISKHTFEKGMVTDKSTIAKDNNSYDYAENLRHTGDDSEVLGSLTTLKGFEQFTIAEDILSTLTIVAQTTVRDVLYLFCTSRPSAGGSDSIYKVEISYKDKTLGTPVLLYGGGDLGLSYLKNTDVVSIYENSEVIKLYWTTEDQPLKVANVYRYLTSNGLVKSGSNSWVDADRFNMVTSNLLTNLNFEETTSGNLSTGRVQYHYSLYKKNLQETLISGPTKFIDLFQDRETSISVFTKGDYTSVNTNKGVKLSLTLDSSDVDYFDYIRLYRVHYEEYNQLPTISIVNDFSITSALEYSLIDVGESFLGELTPEEFSILLIPYTGKTIATKDNRLFMGNINESLFGLPDFDARAYRFFSPYPNGTSGTTLNTGIPVGYYEINFSSTVNLIIGSKVRVTFAGAPVGGIQVTVTSVIIAGDWYRFALSELSGSGVIMSDGLAVLTVRLSSDIKSDLFSAYAPSYITPQYTIYGSTLSYPNMTTHKEYNCINPYNDIDQDLSHTKLYMYQSDGNTYGGEGPEIKYTFTSNGAATSLDDTSTYSNPQTYRDSGDFSHTSIIFDGTGYQRDEVYRFGVVFYNSIGQKSKVKWIGDIRFPSHTQYTNYSYIANDTGSSVASYSLGINVSLKNGLPTGAVAWGVVRAIRTKDDRSVITSGFASYTTDTYNIATLTGVTHKNGYPLFDTSNVNVTVPVDNTRAAINKRILNVISPEEIIQGYSDIKDGDHMDIVGDIISPITYTSSGSTYPSLSSDKNAIKYRETKFHSDFFLRDRYTVSANAFFKAHQFAKTNDAPKYPFNSARYGFYELSCVTSSNINVGGILFTRPAYHGACSVVETTSTVDNTYFNLTHADHCLPYVLIKRNNISRYGGSTYLDRENTKYISCGTVSSLTAIQVYHGDTYINYFDNLFRVHGYLLSTSSNMLSVIFPTESTINLSLRSDDHPAKTYGIYSSYITQEIAGDYTEPGGDNYNQLLDLYLYNSIYSQEPNINFSYALNNIDAEDSFDSRIIYSNKKINNELIDSWLKFNANDALDVDSKFGSIQAIRNFNNDIYFWQENAFGTAPVNERSLITDNNPGALSLGTGDILTRYFYYTKQYGCKDILSIINTGDSLYWIDRDRKTILVYDGSQILDLPKVKGFKKITKELIDSTGYPTNFTFSSAVNQDYNEVFFKLSASKQLIFNTMLSSLSSVLTSSSELTFNVGNILVTHHTNNLFGHDNTEDYNELLNNGTLTKKESVLRITDKQEYDTTKVYDNISLFSNSKYTDIERYSDTFDTVSFWNDYQYTGITTLTLGSTLRRSERGISFDISRNIVNANGTTNIDIFNPTNHSTSRTFKERMRDKYITAEFKYDNTNIGKLYVPYISFMYRTSKR